MVSDPVYNKQISILIQNTRINQELQDLFIDNGKIVSIGSNLNPNDAELVIDGEKTCALVGLVNTHTHAAMTLLRGYADDMHLQEWLSEKIWPLEAHLTADDVYIGTKLACLEMIKSGTTAFNDMYFFMDAAARAVDEAGMRAQLSHGMITFGDGDKFAAEQTATKQLIKSVKQMNNPRITAAVAPHAPYTVPPDHLEWCAEYSAKENIGLHIHVSETKTEVDSVCEMYGKRPAFVLDEAGCLTEKTVLAHGCWLNSDECTLVAQRGASVAYNPCSNMKLATGRALPYAELKSAGGRVCLGTDGCSSNNNLDMFEEMKFAALFQKSFWNQDVILPAPETLEMATVCGAQAMGLKSGILAPGFPADIVLVSLDHPSMVPLYHDVSNLVYAANGSMVETVLCDGALLMYQREVPGEKEILSEAAKTAQDLISRGEP
jgi:5-methylthioadenosine/S-adenosylhomocysteine deaminase